MKAVEMIRISLQFLAVFSVVYMPSFIFHAPCPFGLEGLLADEIRALNADPDLIRSAKGGVSFAGGLELGMAVCLHSRFATRVLLRVAFDEYWDSEMSMRWPKRRRGKNGLAQMRPSASTLRPTAARSKS